MTSDTIPPPVPKFSSSSLSANKSSETNDNDKENVNINEKKGALVQEDKTAMSQDMIKPFSIPSFKSSILFNKPADNSSTSNVVISNEQLDSSDLEKADLEKAKITNAVPKLALNFESSLLGKHAKSTEFNNSMDSSSEKGLAEDIAKLSTRLDKTDAVQQNAAPKFESMFFKTPVKTVRLANGKEFQLRPKTTKSMFSTESEVDLKTNYGISIHDIYLDMHAREAAEKERSTTRRKKKFSRGPLWVEKWRPKSFLDLVGNEKANRLALRWLRHWSTAVYGEDISGELSKLAFNRYQNDANTNVQSDPFNRPNKKILLLHGPPGIGKTTIAHLIAKHLKYETLEINASDERAGQHVRDKIHNSLDTHTFSGNPTCIIADEVDGGSENGFIKVLVDLVGKDMRATRNLINRNASANGARKKGKAAHERLLLRPIIAICNDLYAPVLEKLRPHCEIIGFKKAGEEAIKARLQKICAAEKLPVSTKDLAQVIAIGNSDIRSCLNLLQFNGDQLSNQEGDTDMEQLRAKDTNLTWYSIVNLLFKINLHESKSDTFTKLHHHLNSTSSVEKIMNGCYQVYPQTVYNDPKLVLKSDMIGDWLYFYDRMLNSKYQQNSELIWYCNQVPLKFYTLFAEANTSKPKSYNNISWEYYEQQKSNFDICQKAILNNINMKPSTYAILKKKNEIATEILPLLNNYIFNPVFNDKNKIILSNNQDKKKLYHLVDLLKDFDFKVEDIVNGQGVKSMALLPVMDSVTLFKESSQFRSLDSKRQSVLKYLYFEIEKQRSAQAMLKRKFQETLENEKATQDLAADERDAKVSKNNGSVDFFKASYANVTQGGKQAETKQAETKQADLKVWVKYNEGFSDAVRKNVSWSELWS